jgi:anti-sigma factor ChrR (cupin superfamily)
MTAVADILELLPLHALGALDDDEADAVERAVAADPALGVELARWRDTAGRIGEALLPTPAPATVRARLLADVGAAAGPARFAAQVGRLFDVDVSRAQAVLAQIDDTRAWTTMAPGIRLLGVKPGARHEGAQCGLLRVAAGARFPWHAHLGEEVALVLHGGARMADGRQVGPGDEIVMGVDGDDPHDFVADDHGDDAECIFAVRGHGIRLVPRPT